MGNAARVSSEERAERSQPNSSETELANRPAPISQLGSPSVRCRYPAAKDHPSPRGKPSRPCVADLGDSASKTSGPSTFRATRDAVTRNDRIRRTNAYSKPFPRGASRRHYRRHAETRAAVAETTRDICLQRPPIKLNRTLPTARLRARCARLTSNQRCCAGVSDFQR